jgi:TIR domain
MTEDTHPPTTTTPVHDVFISFSSRNLEAARCICRELEERGITCWLADPNRGDIPAGEDWLKHLMQALKHSRMLLLIFSKDSNISDHVQSEIGIAFSKKLNILPLRIQEEQPTDTLEYYLIHTQWFDFMPPPPPLDQVKVDQLIKVVRHLIQQEHRQNVLPAETHPHAVARVPLFSTWVLKPFSSQVQRLSSRIPALDGALWTFLAMFLVFFLPLAISHRAVGDLPPQSLAELFSVVIQTRYYYPNLNALIFDMLLHPAAFATLVYLVLFLGAEGNQYLFAHAAGFIPTRNVRWTRFWTNLANFLLVRGLPLGLAVAAFFYRRQVYQGYGMKEPLVFWAVLAVGLSIYAYVAMAVNACYMALLLQPRRGPAPLAADDRQFSSERAGMLARLVIVFTYIMLMFLVEIVVQWLMARYSGSPQNDLITWIVLVFGGLSILVLSVRLLWLFVPEINADTPKGTGSRTAPVGLLQVRPVNLLLLILPVVLILLTIRLWLQVR